MIFDESCEITLNYPISTEILIFRFLSSLKMIEYRVMFYD